MNKQGFTLVEMLIVVVIIGVLSAVLIPRYSKSASSAKENVCKQNVNTINRILEMIAFEESISLPGMTGQFPTGNFTADIGDIPLAVLQRYFPQGGMECKVQPIKAYYIDGGRVDIKKAGYEHVH